MKNAKLRTAAVALFIVNTHPLSAEVRQHGSHEHGVAQLQLAIENQQVQILLESPMFNLAGFGVAQTDEQREVVEEIEHTLLKPLSLFDFGKSTCSVVSVDLEGGAFESHEEGHDEHEEEKAHEEEHDEHHDEHEEEKAHKDEHDEHHDEHEEEKAHEDEHDEHHDEHEENEEHHEEHDEGNHADVHVEWVLDCTELDKLSEVRFALFERFVQLEQLNVQYIAGDSQGAAQLNAEYSVLQF